jgi:hypothetical protein
VLGYVAVGLVLKDAAIWGPWLIERWRNFSPRARAIRGAAGLALFTLLGVILREFSSDLFARFSREEGIWEPVSLTIFVGSALLLLRTADTLAEAPRRHVRLVASGFVILSLEEVDYLGIFGAIIGRIEGIYTGSLHDMIRLAEAGLIGVGTFAVSATITIVVTMILTRRGYLQPSRIWSMMGSWQGIWLMAGMGFLMLAAAQEASIFGVNFALPNPEEFIESIGGLCLGIFTLEIASTEA